MTQALFHLQALLNAEDAANIESLTDEIKCIVIESVLKSLKLTVVDYSYIIHEYGISTDGILQGTVLVERKDFEAAICADGYLAYLIMLNPDKIYQPNHSVYLKLEQTVHWLEEWLNLSPLIKPNLSEADTDVAA